MGKKKQKQQPVSKEQNKNMKFAETRERKPTPCLESLKEEHKAVFIPADLEKEILNFIQEENKVKKLEKGMSKRLTSKKLGVSSTNHCMTIKHGDFQYFHDKLPSGFSDTLQKEEDKVHVRPKFDTTLLRGEKSLIKEEDVNLQSVKKPLKERYIELTAFILDLNQEAAETKQMGNEAKQKELSKQIREIIVGMDSLGKHPDFDLSVKIKNIECEKASGDPSITAVAKEDSSVNPDLVKVDYVDDIGSGMGLIEQAAARTPL
ncbi:hypothetical protein CHS0354_036000 [Potamilus streckersoni]|uniref:Uncharacterized protein n=1 Tax=Potamilus streckersoni TaxID=2493646 RepID=A0AAE0T1K5_9BIVA|nr:hypothetical protein CHS0354_036000 [Potamilus streckersoni]